MILKQLRLQNIRSYIDETINFPEGNVLLAGDIGSGKSTILFGLEFALFGILRGDLSGSTLLRHGETKASVQLTFDIDGKEIIISRSLKRTKTSISQEAGFIVRDGVLKRATPLELKAEIINLLGYPPELLTKNKNLIYRFTVYTPQEEMKAILHENAETRLTILRKLFNIDKYQRIRDNSSNYLKGLREKIKHLEGQTLDLRKKRLQLDDFSKQINQISENLNLVLPKLESQKLLLKSKEAELDIIEIKIKTLYKVKQDFIICDTEQKSFISQIFRYKSELLNLDLQIKELNEEIGDKDKNTNPSEKIISKKDEVLLIEKELRTLNTKIAEINLQKRQSSLLSTRINNIDNCPTCLQEVNPVHKKSIFDAESEKIKIFELKFLEIKKQNEELESKLKLSKSDIDKLIVEEKEIAIKLHKIKSLNNYLKRKEEITDFLSSVKQKIGAMNIKKIDLKKSIDEFSGIEEIQVNIKTEFANILALERKYEIEHRELAKEKQSISSFSSQISLEIKKKEFAKIQMANLSEIHSWIADFFIPLTSSIEKQVFTKIFHQFNSFFESWFSLLMEDENLTARLDDTFSPILVQNGFETSVANLSGGEKTACALAYRLALNKVINEFIGSIQTRDLLILDEPTDGFSSDQVDKIRDVLEELGGNQTIIVSHEAKIESFVDCVLKVTKRDHVSEVLH